MVFNFKNLYHKNLVNLVHHDLDQLAPYVDQVYFFDTVSLQMTGVATVLELYKASHIRLYEEESTLENLHAWTSKFLKQQLLSKTILDKQLQKKVIATILFAQNFY